MIFADGSYFELIAYRRPRRMCAGGKSCRARGGFVDFALLPEDVDGDLAAARARGLALNGPFAGGRLRQDGARLDWKIVRPATSDLPFWCGDVTPRELRVPTGEMRAHANGVTGIASVTVAVRDAAASAGRYAALVGSEKVRQRDGLSRVALAGCEIVLADDAQAGTHIAARGEGPMSLALRGASDRLLDVRLTHGATMSIAV
ncbi:MAG: VOC family protein [Xanthobacteraceae bacterium]